MTSNENEEVFVKVLEKESCEIVELPVESDGTLSLTTLQGQCHNATGLRYRSPSGGWRGIRISGAALNPPLGGWCCDTVYQITTKKDDGTNTKGKDDIVEETQLQINLPLPPPPPCKCQSTSTYLHPGIKDNGIKRKTEDSLKIQEEEEEIPLKRSRRGKERSKKFGQTCELKVLDLPMGCIDKDLQDYFSVACGEMYSCHIKRNPSTQKSHGFGILRFKTPEGERAALTGQHSILESNVKVMKKVKETKIYVGGIPKETSDKDLKDYFEKFVHVMDVYIPRPVKGFAYVTVNFPSRQYAQIVLNNRRQHKMTLCKSGKTWDVQLDVRRAVPIPKMKHHQGSDTRDYIDNRRYTAYNSTGRNYGNDTSYGTASQNIRDISDDISYMSDYRDNTRSSWI